MGATCLGLLPQIDSRLHGKGRRRNKPTGSLADRDLTCTPIQKAEQRRPRVRYAPT